MECWRDGVVEWYPKARRAWFVSSSLHYSDTPSPHLKSVRCPVAKEVGMGNPAEKTTRHPTFKINSIYPGFGKYFFCANLARPQERELKAGQLAASRRFEHDCGNRLVGGESATGLSRKFMRLRMFHCALAACFLHPIHQTGAGRADVRVAGETVPLVGDRFAAADANPINHFECGSVT